MNAERLLRHYEKISDASDAIARLRRFILDLAVRGKLVPQDTADEPASELLKRIAREKARLTKTGEIRKPKVLPDVKEPPFEVPRNWCWTPIREITSDRGQKIPQSRFTYIDVTAIDKEAGLVADPKVLEASEAPSRARKITCKGDVIYSCVRPYLLNVAVIETDFDPQPIASTAFAILNGYGLVMPRYLWIVLRSPFMVECVEESQRGQAYPAINDADFAVLPFPLPPLAEQHRIIAKVNELMDLCDRLAAARESRESVRDRLAAAVLARLSVSDSGTFEAEARFALDALPALTTRFDQIKALRQTIIGLAVRGRLVKQDSGDEPASELLKRIAKKRTELLKAGYPNPDEARTQIKKVAEQEVPDNLEALPSGWAWATLLQCSALVIDCKNKTAPYASSGIRLIRTTNVRDGRMNLNDQKYVNQKTYEIWSARCQPEPGDILITREAPMGEVCLIPPDEQICLGQRMMLARLVPGTINSDFMIYSLRDPKLMDRVQDKPIGATVQHLRVGGVETLLVPLPPLAEQERIVAKVNALMALCDRLEASLVYGASTRRRLLDALLAETLAPAEDRELEAAE